MTDDKIRPRDRHGVRDETAMFGVTEHRWQGAAGTVGDMADQLQLRGG